MKAYKMLLALPLVLAVAGQAHAQAPKDAESAKPVAVVNGVPIPAIYAEFLRNSRTARGQAAETLTDASIRDALVVAELLAQEAQRAGLDKNPRISAMIEFQRKELLGRALLDDYLRKRPIAEETIRAEYDKAKERAGGTEYRVRHILVPTEKEARDLIARIKTRKAKFEDLAKKHSQDPSAGNGGDLGWVAPAGLVTEFAEAMTKLKKGELGDNPVQTRFGWHVIRLDDVRPLQFPTYEEARERIVQQLQQIAIRNYVRELGSTAKVE
jgi:peptidyl-prolyl cis-trans isomerase C